MRVIATAGHVDHGKSTVVQALTGTDPDRLAEEKRRGLTIELGFAGMTLPAGEQIAFVDVPGHRRFIGNMLAGLGPAPVVMFVVAADQGWQAQSQEHLEAVDALGISRGLLVLTRCGLADSSRIAAVRQQALARLAETSLGDVPVVETDAVNGQGVDELRNALDTLVTSLPPVESDAPVRLWVDRSFTIKGAGTVVTGTLGAGQLRVDDTLTLAGQPVVIRSVQVLGREVESVLPVSRAAVGLRGVSRDDVPRGSALLTPGAFHESTVVDVRAETGRGWSEASETVSVHVGTASVPAHVRPFDERHARLTLEAALPLRLGERVIVRDDSAVRIHAGVTVLDLDPKPLTRRGAGRERSHQLTGWVAQRAQDIVADRGVVSLEWLQRSGATGSDDFASGLAPDRIGTAEGWVVSSQQTAVWMKQLQQAVSADAEDPLSQGLAVASIQTSLGVPAELVPQLVQLADLTVTRGRVVSSRHGQSLGAADQAIDQVVARLRRQPFDAPEADDLAALGLDTRQLATAAERGVIIRLPANPADIVLLPDAPARAMREIAKLEQPFTVSQARAALGTTRRIIIPLLEHLDGRGWTRREGNVRFVVR